MTVVRCNNTQCYWNAGETCKLLVINIQDGICNKIVKNGKQVNPEFWMHPVFDDEVNNEQEELVNKE